MQTQTCQSRVTVTEELAAYPPSSLVAVIEALLDYALKAEAASRLASGEELVQFFAVFYTTVGLFAFALQATLGGAVLHRLGLGGAIALLPDGAGNITPNAEFNFWVDPEAAYVTLRSGIPVELSPLNVSRKSALDKDWYEKMVAVENPLTELLKETLGRRFETDPDRSWFMYDQITVASIIDPSLVTSEKLYVDVNIDHGISYGASVGGREIWPGAEGAALMNVQHDLDWPRFIEMFIERVQRPIPD